MAVALFAGSSALLERPVPCGALAPRYQPLIAFELARTVEDLHAIFGAAPSTCRATLVAALDKVNYGDVFAFIPAYTLFLCAWFYARRDRAPALARASVAMALVAAAADYVENVCLFSLTSRVDQGSLFLSALPWATAMKWLTLAALSCCAGALLLRGSTKERFAALFMIPAPLVTAASIASPARWGFAIMQGITLSWVVMLALAVVDAWRSSRR